jgi:hypothetical protein
MRNFLMAIMAAGLLQAAETQPVRRGKLLLEEEFSGSALASEWKVAKGKWSVAGGKATGVELAGDKHAAVIRRNVAFRDGVIEVSFQMLPGAKMTAISLNSAQGHSCRVTVRPGELIVQKDKTNAKSTDKAVVLARKAMTFEPGKWYTLTMEVRGTSVMARVNHGEPVGGAHEAIAIDRTNIGLPVSGAGVVFESLRVWEAH